jgi:hypothetical protein
VICITLFYFSVNTVICDLYDFFIFNSWNWTFYITADFMSLFQKLQDILLGGENEHEHWKLYLFQYHRITYNVPTSTEIISWNYCWRLCYEWNILTAIHFRSIVLYVSSHIITNYKINIRIRYTVNCITSINFRWQRSSVEPSIILLIHIHHACKQ